MAGGTRFTPEEKYAIFLEAAAKSQPVGEILQRHGLRPGELSRIREAVRRGAVAELSKGPGRPKEDPEKRALRDELARVEAALKEMSIRAVLPDGLGAAYCRQRPHGPTPGSKAGGRAPA
jgi:transposase-like protein